MIEYDACEAPKCWIPGILKYPRAIIWPKWHKPESLDGYWIWDFYVEWDATAPKRSYTPRGKVNGVKICRPHHIEILDNIGKELAIDIKEQEAQLAWEQSLRSR